MVPRPFTRSLQRRRLLFLDNTVYRRVWWLLHYTYIEKEIHQTKKTKKKQQPNKISSEIKQNAFIVAPFYWKHDPWNKFNLTAALYSFFLALSSDEWHCSSSSSNDKTKQVVSISKLGTVFWSDDGRVLRFPYRKRKKKGIENVRHAGLPIDFRRTGWYLRSFFL